MFKMTDLKLGTKVLIFKMYYKTCETAIISKLTLDGNITVEHTDGTQERLNKWDYKRNTRWYESGTGTVWCFPNATRYIRHMQNKFNPKTVNKVFADYDKYSHDNNKKQIERNLAKQRKFVNKVIEQGYFWYLTHDYSEGRKWEREDNPQIRFRDNNYFLLTHGGEICAKKEGRTLSLTRPNNL